MGVIRSRRKTIWKSEWIGLGGWQYEGECTQNRCEGCCHRCYRRRRWNARKRGVLDGSEEASQPKYLSLLRRCRPYFAPLVLFYACVSQFTEKGQRGRDTTTSRRDNGYIVGMEDEKTFGGRRRQYSVSSPRSQTNRQPSERVILMAVSGSNQQRWQ